MTGAVGVRVPALFSIGVCAFLLGKKVPQMPKRQTIPNKITNVRFMNVNGDDGFDCGCSVGVGAALGVAGRGVCSSIRLFI